jgi:hypothetical protein
LFGDEERWGDAGLRKGMDGGVLRKRGAGVEMVGHFFISSSTGFSGMPDVAVVTVLVSNYLSDENNISDLIYEVRDCFERL